jgi:predicted carbohydrate-binding protein with CBM5 and CBM33 domain
VLILPPGHAETVGARRPLSTRERWILRGVLAIVAAIAVVVVISLATASKSSSHGCIRATIPGVVGAGQISQCGAAARSTCEAVYMPGAYSPASARTIAAECRKAGLPVGH